MAPLDARNTGLPSESMDLITSNSTLEHVPRDDIAPLLTECRRLLRDDGVICFRIDYEDHYAIGDDEITGYNFLRYSESGWERYNSRLQYQNRLRHPDYLELFEQQGLSVVHVETLDYAPEVLADLEKSPIHDRFRRYSLTDLGKRKATFLLRKSWKP
jgi:SAM-dependent methyltransferase